MKQIIPPMKAVAAICGRQKPQIGCAYRFSRHCISVPCADGEILYHTLTGEAVCVSSAEEKNELIARRFLVPEEQDECAYADQILQIVKMLQPKEAGITDFTILTTTDCNARCFYCYELGIQRMHMKPETAKAAAEYIAHICSEKPVKLRWFGGEPLYNREAIDIICDVLEKNGVSYDSSMVSNGYYLDKETVKHAVSSWNLKKVQITIDGTEGIYNRTKAYIDRNDDNPYLRVMNNIRSATEAGIKVTIRLNMDAGNAEDLLVLADELGERFSGCDGVDAYVALLHTFAGKIHEHTSQQEALEQAKAIREKLSEYDILKPIKLPSAPRKNRCMADSDNTETILPDGRTGCCEHYCEGMVTGSIRTEERNSEVIQMWKEPLKVPECADCPLYPQCRKLKKCEWNKYGCTETERLNEITEIKEQLLSIYEAKQREEKDHETEE